jgi:hypothetical protein
MVSAVEVARSAYGAWRLARLDPNGMALFNTSREGAINSFAVAGLVLPVYLVFLAIDWAGTEVPVGRIAVVEAIAYVIGWTAFPVLSVPVLRLMDRSDRLYAFLSAYNWSHLVQMAVIFPVFLVVAGAGAGSGAAPATALLALLARIAVLVYEGYVIKVALGIGGTQAAGMVLLDLGVGLMLNVWSSELIQPG